MNDIMMQDVAYDHAAYEAAMQEAWEHEEAVREGRLMDLMHCYLCFLEETGHPVKKETDGPLRGIVRESTTRGYDPYALYILTCGHSLI